MNHQTSKVLVEAWNEKEGPIVFTTVDSSGIPNSIYATCTEITQDGHIVIADNYFSKTKENIVKGSSASVLFITKSGQSFQVKGEISYETSGENFQFMKSWNPTQHPGNAATVISVKSVYSGGKQLL